MKLENGTGSVFVNRPFYSPDVGIHIDDDGASKLLVTPLERHQIELSMLSSGQTITNNTNTDVIWTQVDSEVGDWFSTGTPNLIVVPDNEGIRRLRVTAQVRWGNNSNGSREVKITRNASEINGAGNVMTQAAGTTQTQVIGEFSVTDGDVIRLVVRQTSGTNQLLGQSDVWMIVEEVT